MALRHCNSTLTLFMKPLVSQVTLNYIVITSETKTPTQKNTMVPPHLHYIETIQQLNLFMN
jgi:hypothetical protein